MKRALVVALDRLCAALDRLPAWTYRYVGRWASCSGVLPLSRWSDALDRRWDTGVWPQ